jgi:hypothetical protein
MVVRSCDVVSKNGENHLEKTVFFTHATANHNAGLTRHLWPHLRHAVGANSFEQIRARAEARIRSGARARLRNKQVPAEAVARQMGC